MSLPDAPDLVFNSSYIEDVGDWFNVIQTAELDVTGGFNIRPPTALKGDYIDPLAEMDILTAISASPSDTVTNDYRSKPLGVKILQ